MYINILVIENITANSEAITGKILNQSWEVDIDESIGKNLSIFLILI